MRATGNEKASGSLSGQPIDRGAAWIPEPEQARALVERLAGGVVQRRSEDRVAVDGRGVKSSVWPPLPSRHQRGRFERVARSSRKSDATCPWR